MIYIHTFLLVHCSSIAEMDKFYGARMLNTFCTVRTVQRTILVVRRCLHDKANQQEVNNELETDTKERYGYAISSDGFERRDYDTKGIVHVGMVHLPSHLKDSLKLFYETYPRKQIVEDGLRLSRHLSNRGRPTHATWLKYKQRMKSVKGMKNKVKDRNHVKKFSLQEAVKAGLVSEDSSLTSEVQEEANDNESNAAEHIKASKTKISRPSLSEYSMIRYGSRETAAFAAAQLPSVYGSTYKALHEIKTRATDYEPKTLLDFGSGTGMSVWAAHEIWKKSISEYQCVDASEYMNSAAEFLLRGSSSINDPLKIPNVYFKRFLPLSNQVMYDIVIASYTLTEMPFRKQRQQALQSLWGKTKDFLVIIEPGNNEGFDTVLQARKFITESEKTEDDYNEYGNIDNIFDDYGMEGCNDEGHIFSPCTHELACARTDVETRDHPCNFSQKVELSFAFQSTPLKRLSYFNERFSYVILRKGKAESVDNQNISGGWARILEPVKLKRRHVICELCCCNGNIEKHVITKKKDKHIYKAARHILKWGDMLPLEEAKRPMNIRSPPDPK